jgi:hypothetical protein
VSSTIHRTPAGTTPQARASAKSIVSLAGLSAFAVCAVLVSGATASDKTSEAQARYQQERAACISGQSHQDRATCLREAEAALQDAKRGRLGDGQSAYEQNRLARCDSLPPADRNDCVRRMRGEGTASGSVESGGVYRELRTTVPAK